MAGGAKLSVCVAPEIGVAAVDWHGEVALGQNEICHFVPPGVIVELVGSETEYAPLPFAVPVMA
jgi:hypothetical protein